MRDVSVEPSLNATGIQGAYIIEMKVINKLR